jgi:hypothetical protein
MLKETLTDKSHKTEKNQYYIIYEDKKLTV